jgi:thiol:disulfide interchange protein DsbA
MNRRSISKFLFGALLFAGSLGVAQAQQAGKDYELLKTPQPTDTGAKIEVLEFFSYGCPHCFEFEPYVETWEKTLPADVVFKRVPVSFNREAWAILGRIYLTLDTLGVAEKLATNVFKAIHMDHVDFSNEVTRNAWMKTNGVDPAKFNETFKSFSVQSRMQRATQSAAAYQIQGIPTVIIDGKYQTGPAMVQSFDATLKVTNQLIAKARAERSGKK